MIVVVGTISFPPENIELALPFIQTLVHETRAEDGCVSYAYAEDLLRPGVLHISEVWRDWDALKAHGAAAHIAPWREASARLGVHDRNLLAFEAGEGRKL